jgi:hypothetical protein
MEKIWLSLFLRLSHHIVYWTFINNQGLKRLYPVYPVFKWNGDFALYYLFFFTLKLSGWWRFYPCDKRMETLALFCEVHLMVLAFGQLDKFAYALLPYYIMIFVFLPLFSYQQFDNLDT